MNHPNRSKPFIDGEFTVGARLASHINVGYHRSVYPIYENGDLIAFLCFPFGVGLPFTLRPIAPVTAPRAGFVGWTCAKGGEHLRRGNDTKAEACRRLRAARHKFKTATELMGGN